MQHWRASGRTTIERIRLDDGGAVICKRREGAPASFFASEADGLRRLAEVPGGLRVPQVYAQSGDRLLLEDLGRGRARPCDWETAGRALAQVHAQTAAHFGLETDGWCGDGAQDNTRTIDGHAFYVQRRLLPQLQRARDAGLLTRADASAIEGIAVRLPELLPLAPAVLLHGDLWLGNLHACADGRIALIDAAAVHYGWAEADLAMTTLFGSPPAAFYAAYAEASGCQEDWIERAPLLNLYHLLNHLNLFGSGYLSAVRQVLSRFA